MSDPRELVIIAHNIRSTHNVGAIFRTAEGCGVRHLFLSGYTPYPSLESDTRLPHIHQKLTRQIHKTALGTELTLPFTYHSDVYSLIQTLRHDGYRIVGLEQDARSHLLPAYRPPERIALLLGEEVEGIAHDLRALCDDLVEIPMVGQKESFNVSVATGIALYALMYL